MNKFLVRFVVVSILVMTGCNGTCLAILAGPCGLDVAVSGLAAQETVTISVKAPQEADPHTFTCTAQNGTCSHFFDGYAPEKVTIQINRNGVMTTRTLNTTPVTKRASSCSSCTGATVDVAL